MLCVVDSFHSYLLIQFCQGKVLIVVNVNSIFYGLYIYILLEWIPNIHKCMYHCMIAMVFWYAEQTRAKAHFNMCSLDFSCIHESQWIALHKLIETGTPLPSGPQHLSTNTSLKQSLGGARTAPQCFLIAMYSITSTWVLYVWAQEGCCTALIARRVLDTVAWICFAIELGCEWKRIKKWRVL